MFFLKIKNINMLKKFIEKYLFLVILILPFLEFINENYVEFDSFITLNFLLYSIAFIVLIYLILIISKKVFYFIDKDKFNLFFSIIFFIISAKTIVDIPL